MSGIYMLLFYQTLNLAFLALGSFGAMLVVYGAGKTYKGWEFLPLESIISPLSIYATLISALLFCCSLYLAPNPRPPWPVTKFVTVPVILLITIAALFLAISTGGVVSEFVVRGVSLMVMAGTLIRNFVRAI